MVMRADQYKIISPGSPAPITFGMGKDPSQSMSNTPGAGSVGSFGSFGGGMGGGGGQAPTSIPQGWTPDSSLSVTNLAPVHVNASTLGSGSPMFGDLYGGGGGLGGGIMGGINVGNGGGQKLPVKDLAPVNVTAQLPRTPGWYERLWMMQNDHPIAGQAIKQTLGTAIPILPTVFGIANMYERYKHGQPLFGKTMGNLGGTVSNIFNGLGSGPGGPLSSNKENPLYKDLDSSFFDGSGSGATTGGGSQYYNSQLPDYPGLTGLSSYPLSGDPGGYWNQMALHDAAPTYGPFAGYGNKTLPIAPAGILGT